MFSRSYLKGGASDNTNKITTDLAVYSRDLYIYDIPFLSLGIANQIII